MRPHILGGTLGSGVTGQHGTLWMSRRWVRVLPPQPLAVRPECEHVFVSRRGELPPVSAQDLHWLAGLLEGEGSFIAGPPSAPRSPIVQATMVDRDIIDRAGALLGWG